MSDVLRIASRKGLFTGRRRRDGWHLAAPAFLGEPVSAALVDRRDGALYAALNLGHFGVKLHRSEDDGTTWEELPAPAFPPELAVGENPPTVQMIWTLVAGGAAEPGLLWAGTLPGALFRSSDRGQSWTLVRSLWDQPERAEWFGGGYDKPGIHSIHIDPRDVRHLTLGVSCGGVWKSGDGGATWQVAGKGLRAAFMPPDLAFKPQVQDPHRLAHCAADPDRVWCQHHNGIFVSADGGATFAEVDPPPAPSGFGFAVAAHPTDPDTAWFVPAVKDECRVPVGGRFVVLRTRDGAESFEQLAAGLPQETSYDLVYRHALDVDAEGRRLAMGSTTGNLWTSDDGGESWRLASGHLPPIAQVAFG